MEPKIEDIQANLKQVKKMISVSAKKAGRKASDVKLVVVSKLQPAGLVHKAVEAGATILGENYPEEGALKKEQLGLTGIEWHMIGHIQSRKAGIVAGNYDMVHSLDSLPLAVKLDKACQKLGRVLSVLVEVNTAQEETKSGWALTPGQRPERFFKELDEMVKLPNLSLRGLMCMPPLYEDPERVRPYFAHLRRLGELVRARYGEQVNELSMGTSADYPVAIEEGATYVRIGRTILGPRPSRKEKQACG